METEEPPSISVIIPTYNMAAYVRSALDSVLSGDFEDIEVVVVDDGSTDETPSVLEQYTSPEGMHYDPRVVSMCQENAGKSAAVNRGLRQARGDYVTFLDADDQIPPDGLAVRYARREDEYGRQNDLVIGGFEVFDEETTHGVRHPPDASPDVLRKSFYTRWKTPFHLNACLIPRTVAERVGRFDERFDRCMDGDYAMRLLQIVDRIAVLPDVVYRYRKHRSGRLGRLRMRMETARHRARVIWKNYYGVRKWVGLVSGVTLDVGKAGYEFLAGNYKR